MSRHVCIPVHNNVSGIVYVMYRGRDMHIEWWCRVLWPEQTRAPNAVKNMYRGMRITECIFGTSRKTTVQHRKLCECMPTHVHRRVQLHRRAQLCAHKFAWMRSHGHGGIWDIEGSDSEPSILQPEPTESLTCGGYFLAYKWWHISYLIAVVTN